MTAAVYDPAGYASQVTVVDIQRTINQAQALLASSGAAITAGQGYIIDNGGVAQKQKLGVLADKLQEQRAALKGKTTDPRAEVQALVAGEKFDRARAQALVSEKTAAVSSKSPTICGSLRMRSVRS